jgi:malonyl-ACP O-methyltransferase BioC
MERPLTRKTLVAHRFARSTPTYDGEAIVQRDMAQQLIGLISRIGGSQSFARVLELGCGTGLLTELLVRQLAIQQLILNDLVGDLAGLAKRCADLQPGLQVETHPGDMELGPLPNDLNLVVSNAVLHWASEPETMLQRMADAVRPGGILALTTFGPQNLRETRKLTGDSLYYLSLEQLSAKLDRRAVILESSERIQVMTFPSAHEVLQHLKRTGVNSLRQNHWPPRTLKRFCSEYESRFRSESGVTLTYHPIVVVARRLSG